MTTISFNLTRFYVKNVLHCYISVIGIDKFMFAFDRFKFAFKNIRFFSAPGRKQQGPVQRQIPC